MIEHWKTYLEQSGAVVADGRVKSFGDPAGELAAAAAGNIIADLSHFALVRAKGEEARDFLQNQFGNDVRQVTDEAHQLNSYSSPKGRMLAIFRLFRRGGDYYLRLPEGLLEGFLKRLRMFVLMTKVTLEDASGELVRVGVAGNEAEQHLRELLGRLPEAADTSVQVGELTVLRVPGQQPRFEVYGEDTAVRRLWEALKGDFQPVGADAWQLLEIRAGLPNVYPETVEAFVPQMANMQLVGGVSFRKGCYPGQEIVARMQYLGQLKRRMYRATVAAESCPQPGDALYAPNCESGQGTGKVVDAAPSPDGGYELLAVVQIECAESGGVRLGDAEGPLLSLQPLPYSFETPDRAQANE